MTNLIYLSLGSNIRPEQNLRQAVKLLAKFSRLKAVSSVWETKPVGSIDQPNFLNAAALVESGLTAALFKEKVIRPIEATLGRVRGPDKFGPRSIDIDIMLFNREIVELNGHSIPDSEVMERPFVAIPLAEIAPSYQHPQTGQTLAEIAGNFAVTEEEMQLRTDVSERLAQLKIDS